MLECYLSNIGEKLINQQSYDCEFDINLSSEFGDYIYYSFFANNTCNKPTTFDCEYTNYLTSIETIYMCGAPVDSCSSSSSCAITVNDITPVDSAEVTLILLEL